MGKNTLEGWDSRADCHYEKRPSSGQLLLTYKTLLTQTLPIPQTSRAKSHRAHSSSSSPVGRHRLPVLWWQQGHEMTQVT